MKALPAVLKRLPGAFAVFLLSRNELPDELLASCAILRSSSGRAASTALHRGRDPALLQKPGACPAAEGAFAFAATEAGIGVAAVAGRARSIPAATTCSPATSSRRCGTRGAARPAGACARRWWTSSTGARPAADGASRRSRAVDELNRTNTFLSRLHGEGACRCHHLFQDFLRERPLPTASTARSCARRPPRATASTATTPALRFWMESGATAASMPICCCSVRVTAATSPSTPTS